MPASHEIDWTPDQVARFWDYQSKRPSAGDNYFSTGSGIPVAKRTLARVARSASSRILDFGCGTGHFLAQIASLRPDLQLYGVDFSSESIQAAKETCALLEPPPDLRVMTGASTSWPNQTFDAVYSLEVVEHLSTPLLDAMVTEIRRLLKPGGHLVVTTPNDEDLEQLHTCCPNCQSTFHIWQHVRSWSPESLNEYMTTFGFVLVSARATELRPIRMRMLLWIARAARIMKSRPPRILAIYRKKSADGGVS